MTIIVSISTFYQKLGLITYPTKSVNITGCKTLFFFTNTTYSKYKMLYCKTYYNLYFSDLLDPFMRCPIFLGLHSTTGHLWVSFLQSFLVY